MASGGGGGAYQNTARLLNEVWSSHKSLKTLVYDKDTGQLTCTKATFALCSKVLQASDALTTVLEQCPALTAAVRNQGLLYALVYELVAGQDLKIKGGGAVKRLVLQHQTQLVEAWKKLNHQQSQEEDDDNATEASLHNGSSSSGQSQPEFPRYLRVNTLRTTTKDVVQFLSQELQLDSVTLDVHIPDLLALPQSATSLILQQSDKRYDWVMQDKASCFSAYCLVHGFADVTVVDNNNSQQPPRVYLDACAAPGNKTTHLSALAHGANNKGSVTTRILACDKSPTRFASLQTRVQRHLPTDKAAADKVQIHTECADFLTLSSENPTYAQVTDILLDPSCSGSGIFSRNNINNHAAAALPHDRLASLQRFQIHALRHALTHFDNVTRVVYSTCSLHEQENEAVVAAVGEDCGEDWELVAPACLAHWPRRGRVVAGLTNSQAAKLIRVDRSDQTNGFFVACWQRKQQNVEGNGGTLKKRRVILPDTKQSSPLEAPNPFKKKVDSSSKGTRKDHVQSSSKATPDNTTAGQRSKPTQPIKSPEEKSRKQEPAWVKQSGRKKRKRR